jgi:hypothetical protein
MPLKVNVGLSRKIGESNYGSRGASVNMELELDSSLIGEPAKFQERIRQIYALARTSLNEELNGGGNGPATNGHANGAGTQTTNGHTGNGNGAPPANGQQQGRPATQSQVKAIHAIARNLRLDLTRYLVERHRVNRPEDLDLKTASQVIDALKANDLEGRRS